MESTPPPPESSVPPTVGEPITKSPEPAPPHPQKDENALFRAARAKALEDKTVVSLQEKMDTAKDPDASREAARDYYKALYGKMRKIDPSIKDRIDRTEAAALRRIQGRQ
jgi:hypothetical protein